VGWLIELFGLNEVEGNLLSTVLLIVGLVGVWLVAIRVIGRRTDDAASGYLTRKVTSYVLAIIGLIGLITLWIGELGEVGTFFGLLAGGIAIALSDLLKNIAGWFYLVLRRPYRVDDRIEVDGVRGDVIDIRLFRTTLLEIGNWVDADQSTGRIVHVPNGKALSTTVFNATEAFGYLWHELPMLVTFETDWRRAESMLLAALEAAAGHTADEATERIRRAGRSYKIRYTHLTPTVYLSVRDSGILLTGRLLVDVRRRRAVEQQVWRNLLDGIAEEPDVALAYPTERRVFDDPIDLRQVSDHPTRPGATTPAPPRSAATSAADSPVEQDQR
jgi:small-conductance mechanosensitive channel